MSDAASQKSAAAVQQMLEILDLERLEVNCFRGRSPQDALAARVRRTGDRAGAGRGLPHRRGPRPPHSLHAYFLLGGDPKVPIIYEVDRIRDGKSFTTRRVVAIQHGQAIFTMTVSFHDAEPGLEHQAPMPDVPDARGAADARPRCARTCCRRCRSRCGATTSASGRSSCGRCEYDRYLGKKSEDGKFNVWIRATGRLPDDPAIHQCVLAYASDMTLLDAVAGAARPQPVREGVMGASLDHALWFHRPFRADDWLLYAQDSPNLMGARGFSRGLIFTRDGTLVALGGAGRAGAASGGRTELNAAARRFPRPNAVGRATNSSLTF